MLFSKKVFYGTKLFTLCHKTFSTFYRADGARVIGGIFIPARWLHPLPYDSIGSRCVKPLTWSWSPHQGRIKDSQSLFWLAKNLEWGALSLNSDQVFGYCALSHVFILNHKVKRHVSSGSALNQLSLLHFPDHYITAAGCVSSFLLHTAVTSRADWFLQLFLPPLCLVMASLTWCMRDFLPWMKFDF